MRRFPSKFLSGVTASGAYTETCRSSRPRLQALRDFCSTLFALGICSAATAQSQSVPPPPSSLPSPGGITLTGPPTGLSASLRTYDSVTGSEVDVIVGQNTKGPYLLAWKGIRPGSESVLRDGIPLRTGADYTLDSKTGGITFTSPLLSGQIVRVSYQCDALDAMPNDPTVAVPLQWGLWQSGKSSLAFNTLYRSDPTVTASQQTPLLSSLDFVGSSRFFTNSQLNSGLYLDLRGGDWLDRSGIKLADKTRTRMGDLSFQYARAGTQFLQGSAAGLTPGKEIREFLTNLKPFANVTVKTTLRETTDLPDLTKNPGAQPTTTQEAGANVALNLPQNGKVQVGRSETIVTTPGSDGVQKVDDTLKVQHDLAPKTQATLDFSDETAVPINPNGQAQPDQAAYTRNTNVQVKSKPNDQLSITGAYKNELSPTGSKDTRELQVQSAPFKSKKLKKLKVTADVQNKIAPDGATTKRSAQIELPPLPVAQTTLTGGVTQTTQPGKELLVGQLTADAKPTKFVELSGDARLRDGWLNDTTPDPDAVNTYSAKMTLAPSKRFKFNTSYALNPESADGTIRRINANAIGMESDFGLIKLTGQYGIENDYLTLRYSSNMQFGFDLRLTRRDTFSTGFESRSSLDSALNQTTIFRLGYTHKVGSQIDLSLNGSMTQNYVNGINTTALPELKAEAKVGLHF